MECRSAPNSPLPKASVPVLFYNDTNQAVTKAKDFAVGTYAFQNLNGSFTASSAYTKVIFVITFKAASGTAWFDTASLNWAP